MSGGPGVLMRAIIRELQRTPTRRLPWEALKAGFPRRVADKSFHRAYRSLTARGLVYELDYHERRIVVLAVEADRELQDLVDMAHRQLELTRRARGMPVPRAGEVHSKEVGGHLGRRRRSK